MKSLLDTTPLPELRAILDGPDSATKGTVSVREGSPEFHYFAARGELANKENFGHGVTHVADVLAADPARPEFLALVDEYEAATGGLEALLTQDGEERYFATEALRALLWGRAGRVTEALELLMQIARAKRDVRYLDAWALDWLEPSGLGALGPPFALQLLGTVLGSFGEHHEMTLRLARQAERWARLALSFVEDEALDPEMAIVADMMVPGICRKAGLFDEGLALADAALEERPSWHSWTARGLILRRQKLLAPAREAFEAAAKIDPNNVTSLLEAGDMYFENRAWSEARDLYDRVCAAEPNHPWAHPSSLLCAWRESAPTAPYPNDAFPKELYELMRSGNHRANGLFDAFRPFVGIVPHPTDATTNTIQNLLEQLPPGQAKPDSNVTMSLTDIESPSNGLLLDLLYGGNVKIEVTYGNVASPDPREPRAPVTFTLWKREGEGLVPALPEPPEAIRTLVSDLANEPFAVGRAWAAASRAASTLTRDDAEALLACVVHPPPLPQGQSAFGWVPSVQLMAAFVLAHLAPDEPWESSVRRDALRSLLLGPMDWSTEAAIVAHVQLVFSDPVLTLDVHRAFATLDAARPDSGAVGYEQTLLDQWLYLPGLYPKERDELMKRFEALREGQVREG